MKFPQWIKIGLWLLTFISISLFIFIVRRVVIFSGTPTALDIIVVVLWAALLVAPVFTEVDILGIKLKNEIEKLKNDFTNQFLMLRSDIHNQIGINVTQVMSTQVTDNEMDEGKKLIKKRLKDLKQKPQEIKPILPSGVQELFSIRYEIEKTVNQIWESKFQGETQRYISISKKLQAFTDSEIITPKLRELIRDVYIICSRAIHGFTPNVKQIEFVKDVYPGLIGLLNASAGLEE